MEQFQIFWNEQVCFYCEFWKNHGMDTAIFEGIVEGGHVMH
jgi:hypothetical protein